MSEELNHQQAALGLRCLAKGYEFAVDKGGDDSRESMLATYRLLNLAADLLDPPVTEEPDLSTSVVAITYRHDHDCPLRGHTFTVRIPVDENGTVPDTQPWCAYTMMRLVPVSGPTYLQRASRD